MSSLARSPSLEPGRRGGCTQGRAAGARRSAPLGRTGRGGGWWASGLSRSACHTRHTRYRRHRRRKRLPVSVACVTYVTDVTTATTETTHGPTSAQTLAAGPL